MKRKTVGNNGRGKKPTRGKVESGPTRQPFTRLQAKKLRGPLATPQQPPPATSSTKGHEDPSSPSMCLPSSDKDSDCHGTTSPITYESPDSFELIEDMELEGSGAKTPPRVRALIDALYESESQSSHGPVVPPPSSSPVMAHRFINPDLSSRPLPGDVQVAEPIGVGRTETAAPQLWHATTYRKNFTQLTGHEACNPNTPSPADYLSASAADKPVAARHGLRPTPVAENAKLTSEFIEDRLGECSSHPDRHDITGRSCSMGLTDFVNMVDEHDLGEEDVESAALVTVGDYRVQPSSKPTLDLIFHKYGDIVANFKWELSENRSSVLDEVCRIIQAFQGKKLKDVTQSELRREVDRLRGWKSLGLEILWLLERLEGVLEAKQLLYQSPALKDEKDAKAEASNRKKKELGELAEKKIFFLKEIQKMKLAEQAVTQKMISTKQEQEAAEAELKKANEKVSEAKGKISSYVGCPILDKLL